MSHTKKVIQARRTYTSDEHISVAYFEEWVILSDVNIHLAALADDTKAYAKARSSSVNYLIAENECMAKELEVDRQREEQSIGTTRAKMKKAILLEV